MRRTCCAGLQPLPASAKHREQPAVAFRIRLLLQLLLAGRCFLLPLQLFCCPRFCRTQLGLTPVCSKSNSKFDCET